MPEQPRYHINVFWYPDEQCWIADVPDLRPCSVRGDSAVQAMLLLEKVMADWLEAARNAGLPVPEPRYCPALFAAR